MVTDEMVVTNGTAASDEAITGNDAATAAAAVLTGEAGLAHVRDGSRLLLALVALLIGAGALGLLLAGRRRVASVVPAAAPPPPTAAAPVARVAPAATPEVCPECGQPHPGDALLHPLRLSLPWRPQYRVNGGQRRPDRELYMVGGRIAPT